MRGVLIIALAAVAHAAILDRIAVTVGKHVITESDVIRDLRVAAFIDHRPVDLSPDQKRKAADRLVDQALILQEAEFSRIPLPSWEEAIKMVDPVRLQYGDDYPAALKKYEITEDDLTGHLLLGLRAMRYTELRFRPEVQLSDDDLHDFYFTLSQQWKAQGAKEIPTFESAREDLEKLLTDQRMSQALDRWLGAQRAETRILYRDQVFR
jgi:hypothetical protein